MGLLERQCADNCWVLHPVEIVSVWSQFVINHFIQVLLLPVLGGREGDWQHVRKNFCHSSVLFHVEIPRYYTWTPKLWKYPDHCDQRLPDHDKKWIHLHMSSKRSEGCLIGCSLDCQKPSQHHREVWGPREDRPGRGRLVALVRVSARKAAGPVEAVPPSLACSLALFHLAFLRKGGSAHVPNTDNKRTTPVSRRFPLWGGSSPGERNRVKWRLWRGKERQ